MTWRAGLAAVCMAGACLMSAGVRAAPADSKRSELSALREKIHSLQDEIARSEENKEEVADELAGSDKAISAAQRRLREISLLRQAAEAEIQRLREQQLALENEIAVLRKQLGDAVFRMYVEGGQGGARRFLSGDSPNQLSRDAYYLEQIARQRIVAIERARSAMQELAGVVAQAETRRTELLRLEQQRRGEQEGLQSERRKQREVLEQIASQLRGQRKQMQTLQRDEARMEKLLRGLEKISRSRPSPAPRSVQSAPSKPVGKEEQISRVAGSDVEGGEFAARKGALAWPVAGTIKARFGSPRAEGGASWRGVFIKTASGADVRAIASGKIAFADWLRGFGNLVIVDHGNGYMSVYGNNESLFKNPGDDVRAGEVLASAGSSGGLEESGLYFEIRHRGQPQDPAKWMAAK
ncbi:peptidase M23 [Uliginosibacterium sp. TH139]|nr:peptidase M23 [Uliginosibacterium sp. TH139]